MTIQIKVSGPIISNSDKWFYDWFDEDSTCPNDIKLPSTGEEVEILINSPGGDVYSGSEIYTTIKDYPGRVTVKILGVAASAASIIAMAGDVVSISPTAQIMIHNPWMYTAGDQNDLRKDAEYLENWADSLSNAYQIKSGKSKEELRVLMDEETWMTAEKAVELGFADEVMFTKPEYTQLVASTGMGLVPEKVIQAMKELKSKKDVSSAAVKVSVPKEELEGIVKNAIDQLKKETVIEGKTLQQWIDEEEKPVNESPFARFIF
ncbi:head maturation protease, ClpP-related [Enterococcus alcedinis]|uniref:ATP-dependent Clp protease proteolytic subunit n=1 Tax=Enterococcus alcedinis TaxID=1274384 RepID=A0A917JEQ1_9ENTE|nr:head maturation protease, ClpP-related [Enterococcus alcedinis]MBP2100967.1 ATP-dependent Clp endopeptidase proteolytic subunit ClpP [Enterococcus alcedinis]GGI64737.1 hypothetical protein GCM10011482_03910 [Enterococcus alcedinis]